jgi:hypothetical protein
MSKQHNKKYTRTHKRRTHKKHTYKKHTHKKRTYKRRPHRKSLIQKSNDSTFNTPDKIIVDMDNNKTGNIIPGLRNYLGNI